jgi:hypothetical protein
MTRYAGIDVSPGTSSICVVDGSGAVLRELKAERSYGRNWVMAI